MPEHDAQGTAPQGTMRIQQESRKVLSFGSEDITNPFVLQVQVPESWAPIVKPEFGNTDWNIEMTYYDTQLVSTGANRDQRLGPWPFPEKRGELSTALLKAVASSGQELWPDWEGDSIADQVQTT